MTAPATIEAYHARLVPDDQAICERLRSCIDDALAGAEARVWHGHPVWFINGNPIVGYSRLQDGVQLLFWSGQSFDEPGLRPEGKFKAADARFTDPAQIASEDMRRWLEKARTIQWDYKNIVKRKGALERLA